MTLRIEPVLCVECPRFGRYHSERATEAVLGCPGFLDHVVGMVACASSWDVVLHACG